MLQRLLVTSTAKGILAASESVAQTLRESGYPDDKIRVIHSGLDPDRILEPPDRERFSLPRDALIFAVVVRITPWKGQDVALEAFSNLRLKLPAQDLRLIFAGGPFEAGDQEFLASLERRTTELGLSDSVTFLGHQADPWPVYGAADVVLVPSTKPDPFPTVVLEAGFAGRPVIVTTLGGGKEAVLDGMTGIVADPTAEGFADAMMRATDQEWRSHAGDAAAAHIRSAFDRHSSAQRTAAEWEECQ
jgi:glycosyltransferase involved in cell wall biosynthesis